MRIKCVLCVDKSSLLQNEICVKLKCTWEQLCRYYTAAIVYAFASIKTTFQFSVEMASHSHKFPMFSPSLTIIFHIYMLLLFVISASTNLKTNSKISGSTESQIECTKFTFNKHVHMRQCITNKINAHTAGHNNKESTFSYIYA